MELTSIKRTQACKQGEKTKAKKVVKKLDRVPHHHMVMFPLKITKEEEAKANGI